MIVPSKLQHKNVILSGVVAIAIIGFGAYQAYAPRFLGSGIINKKTLTEVDSVATSDTNITTRDSDHDGLADWEESLYKSDPAKSDTDGDGTSDGDEVSAGRNPSLANSAASEERPNDMLPIIQDPNFATSSTDIAGERKEGFAKYLAKAGDEIRETTYRDLLQRFDVKKVTPRNQYTDLIVSSDNSPEALRVYGNTFGLFIKKYTQRVHRTEDEILEEALKSQSKVLITELQLQGITYKNFSADLKALKVPSALAQTHLKIVNGYERMSKGLFVMQVLFTDQINGAGGYEAFLLGRTDVTIGYAEVVNYFAQQGVTFTSDEPGYPFSVNIVALRAQAAGMQDVLE